MSKEQRSQKEKEGRDEGRITRLSIAGCFFAALIALLMIWHVLNYRKEYALEHAGLYDTAVRTMAGQLKAFVEAGLEEGETAERAEKAAVAELLVPAAAGNRQFYLFAKRERLLFYQNERLTANREGYSFDGLLEQFRINGGDAFGALSAILQTRGEGTVRFSESENGGYYIGLAKTFTAGEETYLLVYCISEDYLVNIAGANRQNIFVIVFCAFFGAAFIAAVAFYLQTYKTLRKRLREQDAELRRKNRMIGLLGNKLYQVNETQKAAHVKEEKNGIYSEEFLYRIFAELTGRSGVSAIVMLLGVSMKKRQTEGEEKMLAELQEQLPDNRLLFRLQRECFVVLALQEEEAVFAAKMQQILLCLQENYREYKPVLQVVYAVHKEGEALHGTLEKAMEEYRKQFGAVL